jgi:glutathione S-transferase
MSLKLVIGNKNYSSWSMRPWIGLKAAGIPFDEEVISLYGDGSREQILRHSPSGKVPVLVDGDVHVWESLAILEYAAEKFPNAGLWPSDPAARAHARAISTEMHAGFAALREECGMNLWRPPAQKPLSADTKANIARIDEIWTDCRARFGKGGPFLFGRFGAADAMYAPIVGRFVTYAIDVSPVASSYVRAMTSLVAYREWKSAALRESWVIPKFEADYPTVPRLPADAA